MLALNIDGREIYVQPGTTVMQAAEKLGVFVPRYCYHPGLSIAGNCRICLVEVEGSPKLQIACNLPVTDGMVVRTKSEQAEAGRRSVLEFLLANHPLDCPVCDQSGECDLQNFYMSFGLYDPRFREHKVKKKKAVELGPHVMLDQERCILCSRCVRFTDEVTGSGELGIFQRGDRAEVGVAPGERLDNPYSANVIDICPVGALTERDFRFKARVWYLSSAPSVCNGCSKGCNVDLHFVLDRPHLNDGARLVRVKPRYNEHVNRWWMCDEGRYGFGWIDSGRLDSVGGPSDAAGERGWEQALAAIARALTRPRAGGARPRTGVIASKQLTTEELFLVREIFGARLGARVSVSVPEEPGSSDGFLRQADKNPNTAGAELLGLLPGDSPSAEELVEEAAAGDLEALWVFGHDLTALFDGGRVRALAEQLRLFVFSGTNDNATAALAHWVLPGAAYVEKDGTFVSCAGRLQRAGRAFPPPGAAREDWRILLELAERLGLELGWRSLAEVFAAMAAAEPALAGLTLDSIGAEGVQLQTAERALTP